MFDPFVEQSSIKGFHEYGRAEISKMLASNSLMSTISRLLSEYHIYGYIVGEYVRNLYIGSHYTCATIVVFGNPIELSKEVKKRISKHSTIKFIPNRDAAVLSSEYTCKGTTRTVNVEFISPVIYKQGHELDTRTRKILSSAESISKYLKYSEFTINALALGLNKDNLGILYNPFHGIDDLCNGRIVTIDNPDIAFVNNPYLAWRYFVLLGKTNLRILNECISGMLYINFPNISKIKNFSSDFRKILNSSNAPDLFIGMHRVGLLNEFLPELTALDKTETKNGFTYRNDFDYSIKVLNGICQQSGSERLRMVSLLMNIGKPKAKKFNSSYGWSFHFIETYSEKMVPAIYERIGLPLEDLKYVQNMIVLIKRLHNYDLNNISEHSVRKVMNQAGDCLDELLLLYSICCQVENPQSNYELNSINKLKEQIIQLKQTSHKFDVVNSVCINGNQIKSMFKLCSGSNIGQLKKYLASAIISGSAENTYQSLLPLLLKKADSIGLKLVDSLNTLDDTINFDSNVDENVHDDNIIESFETDSNVDRIMQQRLLCGDHCLTFHDDGTYIYEILEDVRSEFEPNEELSLDSLDNTLDFILQCYSNGNVNKVSLDSISKLREGFEYRNGVFKMQQQRVLAVSNNDILIAYVKSKMKYSIKLVQVSLIPVHSIFGLKGYPLFASSEDVNQILSWCVVKNSEKNNISSILSKEKFPCMLQMDSELHKQAIEWIKLKL